MPPKAKFTKEEIVEAAVSVIRKNGAGALTARALGAELGSSARPIFTVFQNMEEVQQAALSSANEMYQDYLNTTMQSGEYPLYKASGMGYIRFAKEEKELFKLLFMRDRSGEAALDERDSLKPIIEIIRKNTGLDENSAFMLHMEMWLYVHGIATMIATSYLDWDMDFASRALTDGYIGLKHHFCEED